MKSLRMNLVLKILVKKCKYGFVHTAKGKCLLQSDGKFHDWEHDKLKVNFNYLNQEITLNFSGVKMLGIVTIYLLEL